MMKSLICILLMVAMCHAAPQEYNDRGEEVVDYKSEPLLKNVRVEDGSGKYNYDYQSKHQEFQETGELKQLPGHKGLVSVKSGHFTFIAPNNKAYKVTYSSDERGFLAQGEHLPTPPPVPEAIQKSLDLIRHA